MVENEALNNPAPVSTEPYQPDEPANDVGTTTEPSQAVIQEGTPEPSGQARLVLKRSGVESEEVFPFSPPAVVGRFDPGVGPVEVDLGVIDEGKYVSRKHARITFEDGVWKIEDLASSNGTYVLKNDFERVEEAELSDGCEIAFGNARFVFYLGGAPAAEPESSEADTSRTDPSEQS